MLKRTLPLLNYRHINSFTISLKRTSWELVSRRITRVSISGVTPYCGEWSCKARALKSSLLIIVNSRVIHVKVDTIIRVWSHCYIILVTFLKLSHWYLLGCTFIKITERILICGEGILTWSLIFAYAVLLNLVLELFLKSSLVLSLVIILWLLSF